MLDSIKAVRGAENPAFWLIDASTGASLAREEGGADSDSYDDTRTRCALGPPLLFAGLGGA